MGNDYTILYQLIHCIRYLLVELPETCMNQEQLLPVRLDKNTFKEALTEEGRDLQSTSDATVTSRYNSVTVAVDYYNRQFQIWVEPANAQPGDAPIPLFIKEITIPFNKVDTVHKMFTRLLSENSGGVLSGLSHQVSYSVRFNVDGTYEVNTDRTPFVTRLLDLLKPQLGYFKSKIEPHDLKSVAITHLPIAHSGTMLMANSFYEVITSKPLGDDDKYISHFIIDLAKIRYGTKWMAGSGSYYTITNHGITESEKVQLKSKA